jgi:hypothetical protein
MTPADLYGVDMTHGRSDLGRWRLIQRLALRASGPTAAGTPEPAARGGGVAGVGRTRAPGH